MARGTVKNGDKYPHTNKLRRQREAVVTSQSSLTGIDGYLTAQLLNTQYYCRKNDLSTKTPRNQPHRAAVHGNSEDPLSLRLMYNDVGPGARITEPGTLSNGWKLHDLRSGPLTRGSGLWMPAQREDSGDRDKWNNERLYQLNQPGTKRQNNKRPKTTKD